MEVQKAEIATVIQNFLPELQQQHPLPGHLLRTLYALQRCRTEVMGGRVEHCEYCGYEQIITAAGTAIVQCVEVLSVRDGLIIGKKTCCRLITCTWSLPYPINYTPCSCIIR